MGNGGAMKKVAIAVLMFFVAGALGAADEKTKAVKMVKDAVKMHKASGRDVVLTAVTDGKFKDGEVYVFCYDLSGTIIAHPTNKALVGKNMINVPDTDGKLFRKDIVDIAKAKGSGWVDYKYKNPANGKVEQKTTYVELSGDIVFCCGIYK
jgi:cytochrome c